MKNANGAYTLLIVDDEEDLREVISFDFRRKGFKVLTAANGTEGFDVIQNNKIDLVISDMRMPGGNGIDLLDRLKAKDVFLPVVMFITGFSDMPPEEAYDRGADAVFAKPFDRKVVLDAVVRALKPAEERFHRADFRVEADIPVGLTFVGSKFSLKTRVHNIGRGGMFVALDGQFPREEEAVEFRVELALECELTVLGKGVVRWVRRQTDDADLPTGCGIEFLSFETESMREVLDFVRKRKMRPFIPRK